MTSPDTLSGVPEVVEVTQADVTEADKAAVTRFHAIQIERIMASDKALGDNRDVIEQAFARHRMEAERRGEGRAMARLVNVAREIAWQAGVGGRETAGAIVSYLVTSPGEIAPFVAGALSPLDFSGDWMRGGCLSWHGMDGKVWTPEEAAAARRAKEPRP